MGDLEKMQPRPFKRTFFQLLDRCRTTSPKINMDAAPRRLYLMSFEGMGKSIRMIRAPTTRPTPQLIIPMSFPAGYSLAGCSPALPASASPVADHSDACCAQLWALHDRTKM